MNMIFLGLVIWNIFFLSATVLTGMMGKGWVIWHLSLGIFTGILTCFTHSLVFIQLIGSGKGIKEAVSTYSLPDDPEKGYIARTKKFKSSAFPYAMFAPMVIIAAAWLGGWHHTNISAAPHWRLISHQFHMWISWLAVGFNLYAFWKEYLVVTENTAMIREMNEVIKKKTKENPFLSNKPNKVEV